LETDKKERFRELILGTERKGIENLYNYLDKETDFFTAPASTKYHGNYEGGLLEHSLIVYELLHEKSIRLGLDIPQNSIIISALLHDVCKCNFYVKGYRNVIEGKKLNWKGEEVNNWVRKEVWQVDDNFPIGHGEKSVITIMRFIELTEIEIMLIRWHMGFTEPKEKYYDLHNALNLFPEIAAIHTADIEAAFLLEKRGDELP
jgi:hypothetical protein